MSQVIVGLIFLGVGAGVYHFNTHTHDRQIVLATLNPDQSVAVLFGLGVLLIAAGAFRWLRRNRPEE